MKRSVLLLVLILNLALKSVAQVGINTLTPDSSSILDVHSDAKGLLIPTMNSTQRQGITNPADGLLVYDTQMKAFLAFDKSAGGWMVLDLFKAKANIDGISGNIVISAGRLHNYYVGIGIDTPKTLLHVGGVITANALNVNNNIIATGSTTTKSLSVNSNINAGGTITASGTVSAANYGNNAHGNGPIPAGGIILWSGSINEMPIGWALCDGQNGTPDLRNRFIVGAGSDAGSYDPRFVILDRGESKLIHGTYKPGNTGGEDLHILSVAELAGHTHGFNTYTQGTGLISPNPIVPLSMTNPVVTISYATNTSGSDQPHENRPPYYALAYIMKLP